MPLIKYDQDKPRLDLIEPSFIMGIANVLTMGAIKYAVDNWKKAKAKDRYRYKAALLRHLYAWLGGEKLDPESGQHHLYHVACNAMFILYFEQLDDS